MPTEPQLRIIHLVRNPFGGIGRHIFDLAAAQAEAGHQVGFVCDSLTINAFENARIDAVRPHLALGAMRLPIARQIAPSDARSLARVHALLAPLAPDVVHAHGSKGGVFGRLAGAWLNRANPVAKIYSPHGGSLHYDSGSLEGRLYFQVERALERLTDAIIHVSAYEQRVYRDKIGVPRCAAAVVRNGLTPHEFAPVAPEPDATDFLYLGMLRDLKGVDLFIEALARLNQGRMATATIVGDGPDEARYRTMVAERGLGDAVRFVSSTPARKAFGFGRTIVVPSRAESMPYVVLEAIAANLPIVATSVGGIPEIFGRFTPELVAPGDPAALAAAMAAALADPDRSAALADARRRHIEGEFVSEAMSSKVESVYRDAIASAAKRT